MRLRWAARGSNSGNSSPWSIDKKSAQHCKGFLLWGGTIGSTPKYWDVQRKGQHLARNDPASNLRTEVGKEIRVTSFILLHDSRCKYILRNRQKSAMKRQVMHLMLQQNLPLVCLKVLWWLACVCCILVLNIDHIILCCKLEMPIITKKKPNVERTMGSLMGPGTSHLKSKSLKSIPAVLGCPLLVKSLWVNC